MMNGPATGASRIALPFGLRINRGLVLMIALLGTLGFYILYPLVLILINSFNVASIADDPVYGLSPWRAAFGDPELDRYSCCGESTCNHC